MILSRRSGTPQHLGEEASRVHAESPARRREIWEYSLERFGLDKAEAHLRDIQRAGDRDGNPRRGVACDEIRSGYRKLLAGSHILFFRVSANRVVVVRILHARMDFDRHLR
jgi:toxin ParE1/3/4